MISCWAAFITILGPVQPACRRLGTPVSFPGGLLLTGGSRLQHSLPWCAQVISCFPPFFSIYPLEFFHRENLSYHSHLFAYSFTYVIMDSWTFILFFVLPSGAIPISVLLRSSSLSHWKVSQLGSWSFCCCLFILLALPHFLVLQVALAPPVFSLH